MYLVLRSQGICGKGARMLKPLFLVIVAVSVIAFLMADGSLHNMYARGFLVIAATWSCNEAWDKVSAWRERHRERNRISRLLKEGFAPEVFEGSDLLPKAPELKRLASPQRSLTKQPSERLSPPKQ